MTNAFHPENPQEARRGPDGPPFFFRFPSAPPSPFLAKQQRSNFPIIFSYLKIGQGRGQPLLPSRPLFLLIIIRLFSAAVLVSLRNDYMYTCSKVYMYIWRNYLHHECPKHWWKRWKHSPRNGRKGVRLPSPNADNKSRVCRKQLWRGRQRRGCKQRHHECRWWCRRTRCRHHHRILHLTTRGQRFSSSGLKLCPTKSCGNHPCQP